MLNCRDCPAKIMEIPAGAGNAVPAIFLYLLRKRIPKGKRVRSVFLGIRKDAEPVELRYSDKFEKFGKFVLPFIRVAGNERRAEGDAGNLCALSFDVCATADLAA